MKNENQVDYKELKSKLNLVGSKVEAKTFFESPLWTLSYHFPYNPDPLCSGNDYSIYDEMIDDEQIKAALSIKKDMVVNTGWMINCENEEIVNFVTDTLEKINTNSEIEHTFEDVLRDILTSYDYGFSLSEPIYEIKDGKYIYKSIKTRPPHSFQFDVNPKGDIEKIVQSTPAGEKNFKPNYFLHHVYQITFGNPYGKSDLRSAFNPWKAKKFFTKFFAMYVERFAMPTVIGRTPPNYSAEEISALHDLLKKMQSSTVITIPNDVTIDFQETTKDSSDIYLKGLDYYNMQIARSILVPDLLGLGGTDTNGGSYALGQEHFKVFLSTVKKDRDSLARKITTKLIMPLVKANFGDIPCWFEFRPWTFDDIKEYLKIWVDAVKGKVFEANDEEINYFRQSTGFPEGDIVRPQKVVNPMQIGQEDENEDEESDLSRKYAYRDLTKYEKKIDFAKVERTLDSFDNKIIKQVNSVTRKMYLDLISQIREKGLLQKFKPEQINNLKPKYQREFNTILKRYYTELFKESYNDAQKELFPKDKGTYKIDVLPDTFLEILEMEAFKTVGDYSFNISKRAKNILVHGIKDGLASSEVMKILKEELGNETEIWADTVLRTKTTEIYNEARKKYWETDEQASQIVEAYQWSSIIDTRTSPICEYLDGKIFEVGELSNRVKPPAHFSCRSILVPITKFEDYKTNPVSDFTPSKLKEKGGGLLSPGGGKRKYQQVNRNSGTISEFGDTIIIAPSGDKTKIQIVSIDVANMDLDKPVIVGFRSQLDEEIRYKKLLEKSGGIFQKYFDPYWNLNENDGLIINLSAPVQVDYTIEYLISEIVEVSI